MSEVHISKDGVKVIGDRMYNGTITNREILEVISETLEKFKYSSEEEGPSIMAEFEEKTKRWQIITLKNVDRARVWMQFPMVYFEDTAVYNFFQRMQAFLRTGVVIPEDTVGRYISIKSNVEYPFGISLNKNGNDLISEDPILKDYYSLGYILKQTEKMMEAYGEECNQIGIYESPMAIVARNNAEYYLSDMEKITKVPTKEIQGSMEVIPFIDLMKTSIVGNFHQFK